ncbi:lipopolysaccharide heptosyltransferase II [Halanaerobium hydrogeniformans]|uniref:lipopolysaccharide heptosyltransferase II n=1 Tax=Halanaerobium hydrogeniformans TaxID=656519 RepID=E4RJX4_HALHG|nr:lipopolysaccharide heptosyltransferase II [Halanaerobium hydrogeniformans]ADQ15544.1 glycosyl transferase family 9 [Halanaerobium hydrogeniformans]
MNQIKRIVVIDLLYLGDLIFAHPFFAELRKLFPKARIDLIANSNFAEIMRVNKNIDNVYSYNKNWNVLRSYEFAKEIKQNNYQLALNIHGNWRTALLLKIVSADKVIGYGSKGRGIFLDQKVDDTINSHMIDFYLYFIKSLQQSHLLEKYFDRNNSALEVSQISNKREKLFPTLRIENKYIQTAEKKLKDLSLKAGFIVLNTGGSWKTKRWPEKYFAELANLLIEKGHDILFVGGPSDNKRVKDIIFHIDKKEKTYNLTGETSLLELAAVCKKANLIISGDTGPVHVAAAVGTNTVTIFGPSDEEKYAPRGRAKNIIIKNKGLDCRPCGEHECPLKHFKCMREIKAEKIIDLLQTEDLI